MAISKKIVMFLVKLTKTVTLEALVRLTGRNRAVKDTKRDTKDRIRTLRKATVVKYEIIKICKETGSDKQTFHRLKQNHNMR